MTSPTERYSIERRVSGGQLYDTYLGSDRETGDRLLFKVLKASAVADDHAKKRFLREFQVAKRVNHPNVCRYHAVISVRGGRQAIVTDVPWGRSLRTEMALRAGKGFELKTVLAIARQLCGALHAVHCAGAVHRDLRADNVHIDADHHITVVNFGLAFVQNMTALTATGVLVGAPEYLPPESLLSTTHDIRVDLYSFGVLLWELCLGHSPFDGMSIQDMLAEKRRAPLPQLTQKSDAGSRLMTGLIDWLTQPEPIDRPASFAEVETVLRTGTLSRVKNKGNFGHCWACGNALMRSFPLCTSCGSPRWPEKGNTWTVLVERTYEPERIKKLLTTHFGEPPENLTNQRLQTCPYAVGSDLTRNESAWVADQIASVGTVARPVDRDRVTFKSSAAILLLGLMMALFAVSSLFDFVAFEEALNQAIGLGQYSQTFGSNQTQIHYASNTHFRITDGMLAVHLGFVLILGLMAGVLLKKHHANLFGVWASFRRGFDLTAKEIGRRRLLLALGAPTFTALVILAIAVHVSFGVFNPSGFRWFWQRVILLLRTLPGDIDRWPLRLTHFPLWGALAGILYLLLRSFVGRLSYPTFGKNSRTRPKFSPSSMERELPALVEAGLRDQPSEEFRTVCDAVIRDVARFEETASRQAKRAGSHVQDLRNGVLSTATEILSSHRVIRKLHGQGWPESGATAISAEQDAERQAARAVYARQLNRLYLLRGSIRSASQLLAQSAQTTDDSSALRLLRAELEAIRGAA